VKETSMEENSRRNLFREAKIEGELADSPEARLLRENIDTTVRAYVDFLHSHGMIWEDRPDEPELPRLKAQALIITYDFGDGDDAVDIFLKDGALDRVYGDGVNPDPWGREADD